MGRFIFSGNLARLWFVDLSPIATQRFYDWNVSAEDMVGKPTRYSIRTNIFKDVFRYDKPVILMHDSAANALTVSMLKDIIEEIRKGGYTFDTLDHRECCQF